MLLLTWIALAFFLIAVGFSAARAGIHGFRALRTFGRAAGAAGEKVDIVARAADDVSRNAAALPQHGERLEQALAAFGRSRGELGVLLGALARVRRTFDGVRGAVYGRS